MVFAIWHLPSVQVAAGSWSHSWIYDMLCSDFMKFVLVVRSLPYYPDKLLWRRRVLRQSPWQCPLHRCVVNTLTCHSVSIVWLAQWEALLYASNRSTRQWGICPASTKIWCRKQKPERQYVSTHSAKWAWVGSAWLGEEKKPWSVTHRTLRQRHG